MANKIALCTTFPNWVEYPKESIVSWLKYLPKEIIPLIGLDPCPKLPETEEWLMPLIQDRTEKETIFISREFPPEQIEFLKRNKQKKPAKDYRMDYVRFSFKVFTINQALIFALDHDFDYLIWLDADVILKKDLPMDKIEEWLPKDAVASYLGRKDWDHSECGFMIFNLKNGGKEFIERLQNMYVTDEVLTLSQWHDSYVFDRVREEFNKANGKNVFLNLSEGVEGRDVFDNCALTEFMEHKKGNRKFTLQTNNNIDLAQLKVETKNCVDHDIILKNVSENLKLIDNWLDICTPIDEEIVIANAGPSLCPAEIKPYYDKGVKIVAVKHALEPLLDSGIIPWACMLLDPRGHVKDFIKHPRAKEILWFVASMVDPEVVKTLLEQGCKVYGYHAYVGAEENKILPKNHKMVLGGSATATRGIVVLNMLGFSKFILFAYDLCALEKPDLKAMKGNRPIWMEVNLSAETYGDKKVNRTFWTKGEFLAQVQEMQKFISDSKTLSFEVHGEGIIPWIFKHHQLNKKWLKDKTDNVFKDAININHFLTLAEMKNKSKIKTTLKASKPVKADKATKPANKKIKSC